MIYCKYNPKDLRYIFLWGDTKEMGLLEKYLNQIPSYQFMPSFAGPKRPEVFLNKFRKNDHVYFWCFSGLWKEIVDWCTQNNIGLDSNLDSTFKYTGIACTEEEFHREILSWKLSIEPRDYQVHAAWLILHYRQSLSQLATRAGKTLVCYLVFRYLMEHHLVRKILMIVPNIDLVKQGVNDMSQYQEFFQTETVWAKGESCSCPNLTIGTFQSLVKKLDRKSKRYNPHFFDEYDCVLCDEAHKAKCESIKQILMQDFMKNAYIRFGFTGTLPKKKTIDSFACQSLMGPKIQDLTTKELQEEGWLADINITQIIIDHNEDLTDQIIRYGEYLCSNPVKEGKKVVKLPKEERDFTMVDKKTLPFALGVYKSKHTAEEYAEYLQLLCKESGSNLLNLEQMLLHHDPKRVEIMTEILTNLNKNCIIFAHHSSYIDFLTAYFAKQFPDKQVLKIKGSVSQKRRGKIIKMMEESDNCILVASYGCASTGITFKNLDYGIFAQSFKSQIINKQSIGRGLLRSPSKDTFYLYDLIDVYPTGCLESQGMAKRSTYRDEGFTYTIQHM